MPRLWPSRRRLDGPAREWDGSRRSDPDRIRMQRHRLQGLGPSADDLLDLRVRIVDVLGQQWRPTRDRQGDEDGHRP